MSCDCTSAKPRFPICRDVVIRQGATFRPRFRALAGPSRTPVDWTGVTVRMQVRETHASATPLLDVPTTHGSASAGSDGVISIDLPPSVTRNLPAPRRCVYDIKLVHADGNVTPFMCGVARIDPEVTR